MVQRQHEYGLDVFLSTHTNSTLKTSWTPCIISGFQKDIVNWSFSLSQRLPFMTKTTCIDTNSTINLDPSTSQYYAAINSRLF
jgi:hypothetical protein